MDASGNTRSLEHGKWEESEMFNTRATDKSHWSISEWAAVTYCKAFIDWFRISPTEPQQGSGGVWWAEVSDCSRWCTGWRRGTLCPSARWWTSTADSCRRHCRRTLFSPRSLRTRQGFEGRRRAAASSRAAFRPSTRSRCATAASSSRFQGSA